MQTAIRNLLNLFFPSLCVVCEGRLTNQESHICLQCLSLLPKTDYHNQPDNRLEDFFAGRFPFERIVAFTYYVKEGSIQKMIHELKYRNNPKLGIFIGELYGRDLKGSDFISNIDYLVPVPLHPKRERERGYNQALKIAEGLFAQTNIPIDTTTLMRSVNNPSQTKNTRFKRWANVEDIFVLTNMEAFTNKHVLLIDDVITTGSTLESCAKEILKTPNVKISILAIGAAN